MKPVNPIDARKVGITPRATFVLFFALSLLGCGSTQTNEDRDFSTSGSREADQRAEQRMAKAEQLQSPEEQKKQQQHEDKQAKEEVATKTLFERLGGQEGIQKIVDDFVTRAVADPRVNWERKGVTRGGWSLSRNESVEWQPSEENIARLKKHIGQFLALATGGPTVYEGKEMKQAHANMRITNAEFDASVGDLKASLDKLGVPNDEQKELLAIIESTRPQIVAER